MGKRGGKNKKSVGQKLGESNLKQTKASENSQRAYDKDTAVFILMAQELKDEGNQFFQTRDYEGAMLKYEKAIKLLPRNHVDVSYLRSNMAACYMQLGITEYPRAIHECNLALEVTPKHSKALLKRARCYEALNKLDLAFRDVGTVLKMEPNNLMAIEIVERVNKAIEIRGSRENEVGVDSVLLPEYLEPPKTRKKKGSKLDEKEIERKVDVHVVVTNGDDRMEEKKAEDKLVVEEQKVCNDSVEEARRSVKLALGEDIRWAQIPLNCDVLKLREVVSDRFPNSKGVLVKYRDQEGDLVTITKTEELRLAEASAENGSVKLFIVEVNPDQDPFFDKIRKDEAADSHNMENIGGKSKIEMACLNDWIIQFAQLFKNNVGFDTDAYFDLHEVGKKLYLDAMEETVTSDEAQDLFCSAAEKFQEMTALALFNWGNVHMSRARKRVYFTEDSDSSRESVLTQVKSAYEWAVKEYENAGKRYEESLKIKPNFYEAVLALGQQQFEKAKLSWYYAIGTHVDLESWPYTQVLQLYNMAEENMEKGLQMWEEAEEQRVNELSQQNKIETLLQKMKLNNMFKHLSADEAAERAASIRAQIHVLWGTMLFERSIMEFKLRLPVWHESLEIAVEKFELAGASPTDIAVMIKNHCSNDTTSEGLGFNIDEIVQAWNEMDEAKRWQSSIQSFRLEPLLRRRVSKIYCALEHA
ncbi:hypothetical protein ACS0TY_024194 [Phlomoides rotata]